MTEHTGPATPAAPDNPTPDRPRHVGRADLLREAVDGLVGKDPPQR